MNKFNPGDNCCVPCSSIHGKEDCPQALIPGKILSCNEEHCEVNLGSETIELDIARVHYEQNILIIEFGDFDTEISTLDPLAKSIVQFSRLLVTKSDDFVRFYKIRTKDEFNHVAKYFNAFNVIILVGHGCETGICGYPNMVFNFDAWKSEFSKYNLKSKLLISLCCCTGNDDFGKPISSLPKVDGFLAPSKMINSALASQYCQTFLLHHFMDGRSIEESFYEAEKNRISHSSFQLFVNGKNVRSALSIEESPRFLPVTPRPTPAMVVTPPIPIAVTPTPTPSVATLTPISSLTPNIAEMK